MTGGAWGADRGLRYGVADPGIVGASPAALNGPLISRGAALPFCGPVGYRAAMPKPKPPTPLFGSHLSIAGGYYRAIEAAHRVGCGCVQIFTKNNNQWGAKPLTEDDVARFQGATRELNVSAPLSHASYLINLASPDDALWRKSIDAMVVELTRAATLGVPHVVVHPGSYTTSSEEAGLTRISAGLEEVLSQTRGVASGVLLENTAGQGSNLGWRFEHLAAVMDAVADPDRVGVCIDTCHAHAAGHAMGDAASFKATLKQLDQTVGLGRVRALHLNDSVKPLGSRVDRHAHIGRGTMGLEPFRLLLADDRLNGLPMVLETPKGEEEGEDLDVMNLRTLRSLLP